MKVRLAFLILFFAAGAVIASEKVVLIRLDGMIDPASADYITNAIVKAEKENAAAVVIEMNTPGGLLESMRKIVQSELSSSVPVVVYIYPRGSRAGSAGVFVTLAANVAAMAPGTNIGAAHPVGGGIGSDTSSVEARKIINDAVAFVKAIAEQRHRNIKWAENAVRFSISSPDSEALKENVIDLISPNLDSLLNEIDGRVVETSSGKVALHTRGATVQFIPMSWGEQLLSILSDPNVTYLLLMAGIFGIGFELFNPGGVLPGVVGGICLILALYAFQTLPLNFAGLALIILAIILFVAEVKIMTHGALAIGGIIALFLGSVMLFRSPLGNVSVSLSIIITTVVVTAVFFLWIVGLGLRAQQRKPTTGFRAMVGETGSVMSEIVPGANGQVLVHGEIWKAIADTPLKKGDQVTVESFSNWILKVKPKN